MDYVVFDMEWNQAGFGRPMVREPLPLEGEIIQIGAIRLNERLETVGEFTVNVKPRVYRKMNRRVQQITHISNADLAAGEDFLAAAEKFRAFCGDDFHLVSWGSDDMRVLRQNLAFKHCDAQWIPEKNYDLQLVYDKALSNRNESSLGAALEKFGIAVEEERPQHNALNDSYYTVQVFRRIGTEPLLRLYSAPVAPTRSGELGRVEVGAVGPRKKALAAEPFTRFACPLCGDTVLVHPWADQKGGRYLSIGSCPRDGELFLRLRLQRQEEKLQGSIVLYPLQEENRQQYVQRIAAPAARRRTRRSRGIKGGGAAPAAPETVGSKEKSGSSATAAGDSLSARPRVDGEGEPG